MKKSPTIEEFVAILIYIKDKCEKGIKIHTDELYQRHIQQNFLGCLCDSKICEKIKRDVGGTLYKWIFEGEINEAFAKRAMSLLKRYTKKKVGKYSNLKKKQVVVETKEGGYTKQYDEIENLVIKKGLRLLIADKSEKESIKNIAEELLKNQ